MIDTLSISGLLSFGWEPVCLPLRSLNVLIGPNGSGKSNLLDVLELLRGLPLDYQAVIRQRGGALEWPHKDQQNQRPPDDDSLSQPIASIEAVLHGSGFRQPIRYRVGLRRDAARMEIAEELLETAEPYPQDLPFQFLYASNGSGVARVFGGPGQEPAADPLYGPYAWRELDDLDPNQSLLSKLRDAKLYPQLTRIAELFGRIRIYQSWQFGPQSALRQPQPADQRNDALEPDARNLGLLLSNLRKDLAAREQITKYLREVYEDVREVEVVVEGGLVQVFLIEADGRSTPATRLSDGTLRWLALVTLLCHPKPPPLLCIEEPELGLHPDLIPTLARLLKAAAGRTQIIVTTHSDVLVSEFSDTPEDVVVCERRGGGTSLHRLARADLERWLKDYSLGHAWRSGVIGGNRW